MNAGEKIVPQFEKEVKVKFVDYFQGFDAEHCWIVKMLSKRYRVVLSDEPDYLFFTVFSDENMRYQDCVKIFISGENIAPDFNLCDYALSSEKLTFGDRHCYYPYFLTATEALVKAGKKHLQTEGKENRAFCSFVVSNGRADRKRTELFNAISAYRTIDSGGRYLNNVGGPVADKEAFEAKHKFSLCCENSSHPGYITEKLVQAFAAGTVPVYWGADDVCEVFNRKAMIFANEYDSAEEVAKRVEQVDRDDELYLSMLREPAFLDEDYVARKWKEVEAFLFSVFDQEKEDAFRRNRAFWGKLYLDKLAAWKEAYEHPMKRVARLFGKKFKRK